MAERILLRKKLGCERFIDYEYGLAAGTILLGKEASMEKGNSHGLQVAWCGIKEKGGPCVLRRLDFTGCPVRDVLCVSRQRNDGIERRCLYSRRAPHTIEGLLPSVANNRSILQIIWREGCVHRQEIPRIEAQRYIPKLEDRAQHQPCARQEHE